MVIHNKLSQKSTYTMLALCQCGFSSAREDRIPVPVSAETTDQVSTCFAGDCVKSLIRHDMMSPLRRPTDLPLFVWGQPDELISRGIFWYLKLQVSLLWQHQPPKNNGLILDVYISHSDRDPCSSTKMLVRNAVGLECAY